MDASKGVTVMKTHKELGITKKEYNAAIKVRDGLREGRYVHIKYDDDGEIKNGSEKRLFNLGEAFRPATSDCGSVACIGGWMATEMRVPVAERTHFVDPRFGYTSARGRSDSLYPLFFPEGLDVEWETVSPKRAAKAIDNFLKTGSPKWDRVVR